MSDEELIDLSNEEEYTEYWVNKGAMQANQTNEYKKLTREKEEKLNMIVEMTVPWQRELVSQLIDDVKSIENARSSIEMDSTVKLIYNENKKTNKL